MKFCKLAMS